MREALYRNRHRLAVGAALLVSGLAWASPWDIDMVNGGSFKGYEWKMKPFLPAGTVSRNDVASAPRSVGVGGLQTDWVTEFDRNTEGDRLQNPYGAADAHTLAKGKRLFQVSCAPCHGVDGTGGGPVTQNDPAKGLNRFPIPAPMLSGEGAVTGMRSDGYIYLTIRDGGAGLGAGMPPYATSLTDRERWAIVSYMRTLEGGAPPPPPAPVETTVPGQEG